MCQSLCNKEGNHSASVGREIRNALGINGTIGTSCYRAVLKAGTASTKTQLGVQVTTTSVSPYLELNYTCNGQGINYRVSLVSVPSNLGIGRVWYFLCPVTGKRCRKLYSVGTEFLHREAFQDCMYESQRRSHKERELTKLSDRFYAVKEAYDQMLAKHYKSHYAEKPTKRHLKLLQQIDTGKAIPVDDLFRF